MLSQKGFSLIYLIFSVLIIIAISIWGYFFFSETKRQSAPNIQKVGLNNTTDQNNQNTKSLRSTQLSSQPPASKASPSAKINPQSFLVKGNSMYPNYRDGQIWLYKLIDSDLPKRLDTVIYENPQFPGIIISKRVIALPNEKVKISDGKVYINDQILEEPYVSIQTSTGDPESKFFLLEGEEKVIPDNSYFLLGDHRPASKDSRELGPVTKDKLLGILTEQIQPLPMPSNPVDCKCLDKTNNICLPEIACQ